MRARRCFIDCGDVYLRMLEREDADGNYLHWFDDEEVCRHNSHHRFPLGRDSLIAYASESAADRSRLVMAIVHRVEDVHIGNVSLQGIDYVSRSAELAIIIGEKDYWGKGYGRKASQYMVDHAFDSLNLRRVHCGTLEDNLGMQRICAALGFSKEGVRRKAEYKGGSYLDVIEYGLLREEWVSRA
ncbi:MAG: GNAT family N-acetyltransferase [Oscillospiraceae bacterium]|nr:GNAT family N-acetyltransferase [Oscillospiraceae bacterium]